jgi:hypothetical protein
MASIKIINVLKDDTLSEILELFRQAPSGEVIFVLPKNGKIFKKEDHFSAFAAEAAGSGKTISLLTSNAELAAMARAYKFNVMNAGPSTKKTKGKRGVKTATLASTPPPADEDIQDTNEDAFQDDVVSNSDETMGVTTPNAKDELEGFHIEDETGPVDLDQNEDGQVDTPAAHEVVYGELTVARPRKKTAAPAPLAPVAGQNLDYIDAVWRDKVAAQIPVDPTAALPTPTLTARSTAPSFWKRFRRVRIPNGTQISRRVAAGILGVSALLLAGVVWATTGSASIVLTPVSHQLNIELTVQASDVYTTVDSSFNKIPGQLFEATASATAEAPATGSRDVASKARGSITIYNEYSSTPQTLVATTRFIHANGLVFRTLQTVTVPGSTVSAGAPVAGSVTVDVIADKPGPEYNVGPGKWVVAAFQERGDAQRAEKIYGVSTTPMSGGASGPSKVVTQTDYDIARASAQDQVREQLKKAFDAKAAGMRVLDEAQPTWAEPQTTARPDDAAEVVSVTVSGTLKTIAFRQADLDTLITKVILQKERLHVLPEQLDVSIHDVTFKPDIGTLIFSISIKGPGYELLNTDAIRNDIKGMHAAEIRDYFAHKEGVESATVSLSPFWVRSVPSKDSRITIETNFAAPEDGAPTP